MSSTVKYLPTVRRGVTVGGHGEPVPVRAGPRRPGL